MGEWNDKLYCHSLFDNPIAIIILFRSTAATAAAAATLS